MNKRFIATFVFVGFVVIPLIINVIGTNITIKSNANFNDWLGFWGSYLGGFVTLTGVYLAFYLERKKNAEERFLDRYLFVLKAKILCATIINSEAERILNSEWLDSKYSNLDGIALEIIAINKEFNKIVQELFVALLNVSEMQKKSESNEDFCNEAKKSVEALQSKARELLKLIESIEGKESA